MHKQMRVCRGFTTKRMAKFEQLLDMEGLRRGRPRAVFDHVVETKLKFLMLAKGAEFSAPATRDREWTERD